MSNIVFGARMKEVTGAVKKEVQIKTLEAAKIPYWLDARGRPVTLESNLPSLMKVQPTIKPKKKELKLVKA